MRIRVLIKHPYAAALWLGNNREQIPSPSSRLPETPEGGDGPALLSTLRLLFAEFSIPDLVGRFPALLDELENLAFSSPMNFTRWSSPRTPGAWGWGIGISAFKPPRTGRRRHYPVTHER